MNNRKFKIGVIGLGDIAQKAYLPIITRKEDLELVFATRSEEVLDKLAKKYNVKNKVSSVDKLIEKDIDAAFVHAATKAHYKIVKALLENDIHVFVDKPITNFFNKSKELVELANKKDLIFFVGFNRRFVPMYKKAKDEISAPKIVKMEKNSTIGADEIRQMIFDDFIHVIDTLRLMGEGRTEVIDIHSITEDDLMHRVNILLRSGESNLYGMMNRNNGITEESLEVTGFKEKRVVNGLTEIEIYNNGEKKVTKSDGWNPMLYNRGFEDMIDEFLYILRNDLSTKRLAEDFLETHRLCEEIVNYCNK